MYTLYYTIFLSQNDMPRLRKQIAYELVTNKIIDEVKEN